jgi:hypothetical protein
MIFTKSDEKTAEKVRFKYGLHYDVVTKIRGNLKKKSG